jgi:D-methionine transport system permease protein
MGGNTWTVVRKVLVPESLPSLISATTTTIIAIIGYSAMAGTVGAGGLGDLAIRYGYQRFEAELMWIIVAILAVTIAVIQFAGDSGARVLHRRAGKGGEPLRFRAFTGLLPGGPVTADAAPAKTR